MAEIAMNEVVDYLESLLAHPHVQLGQLDLVYIRAARDHLLNVINESL